MHDNKDLNRFIYVYMLRACMRALQSLFIGPLQRAGGGGETGVGIFIKIKEREVSSGALPMCWGPFSSRRPAHP
jgi:hypothetical protein